MSNESEVEVTATENSNEEAEVETEAVVPEKPPIVETAEAKMARLTRQLRKVKQQLGLEEEVESEKKVTKQFVLDRADKAYLVASGIKGQDEFDLVTEYVNNTGKDMEDVIDTKFFNNDLKELRATKESRMASDAASGNNRTGQSSRDTVEYWMGKGKLPPPYMTQLRRDVVNARLKKEKDGSKFSENPLVQ